MKKITLIKCEKCGSTSVADVLIEDIDVECLTMDEYIKKHKSRSLFNTISDGIIWGGVSHMEDRQLQCHTCGHIRPYQQVVYT